MRAVATTTLRACIDYTENKTGRIRNFERAAAHQKGKFEGIYYDDSDVYKALEAMAYSLQTSANPAIEAKADEWIIKIAAAQLPDGYLNTYYTLTGLENRWTDMERHEDYCAGHLIEAGIAYANATGKTKLLQTAIRFANHIDSTFRVANRPWVSGHEEIELALMRLYHYTQNKRYMLLANWFLEQRGRGYGKGKIWDEWRDPAYAQDAVPVKQQREITGHAVRAMYLYTGAADVAATTGDAGYITAMDSVWEDVVYRNLYITGGIGALAQNEGFGHDYDLPNEQAYNETCASVGMVFWNQRMNMLSGHAKYIDVLERTLYNAANDGLSLQGDRFFYGNPLASLGNHKRSEWFGTACCPSNIARLVSSLGNYIYGTAEDGVYVNLFIGSNAGIKWKGRPVGISMQTEYPWQGKSTITLSPEKSASFALHIRIPGWLSSPVPGNLYHYTDTAIARPTLLVNGKPQQAIFQNGYAILHRRWQKGDKVTLGFPMPVRLVESNAAVDANRERLAIQRGPLVYCVEGKDNNGQAWNFMLPRNANAEATTTAGTIPNTLNISFPAQVIAPAGDGTSVQTVAGRLVAVPYFTWNNAGPGEMQVWLPTRVSGIRINPE